MNFSRKELKQRAKEFMRIDYWSLFLGVLLIYLPNIVLQFNNNNGSNNNHYTLLFGVGVTSVILGIFILPVLQVGLNRYIINAKERGSYQFSDIFSVFSENYFNVVKVMFLMNLYIFLWTLLFIIPGIIKTYEYRFIPFLLAEDTSMDIKTAFNLTKKYTNENKMDIFVLDLSFIGWYLLGGLIIIGTIFVATYQYATNVELYLELSKKTFTKKYDF